MPVNGLIIRALLMYHMYYGDNFTIECPTGSARTMNLYQVAEELSRRLTSIFLRDQEGQRPVYGGTKEFQLDPHRRDYLQLKRQGVVGRLKQRLTPDTSTKRHALDAPSKAV